MSENLSSYSFSSARSKRDFIKLVNKIARERKKGENTNSSSNSSSKSISDRKSFNRKASDFLCSKTDKDRQRKFINRIEKRFAKSTTNKNFKMPRKKMSKEEISGESIKSLKNVTYYYLLEQNNKVILDETGRLIEIIYELANLDRNELYAHLNNPDSPLYRLFIETVRSKVQKDDKGAVMTIGSSSRRKDRLHRYLKNISRDGTGGTESNLSSQKQLHSNQESSKDMGVFFQNMPASFMRTFNSPDDIAQPKILRTTLQDAPLSSRGPTKNSQRILLSNHELLSNHTFNTSMSPNSKISYDTLKSSESSLKSSTKKRKSCERSHNSG